MQTKRRVQLQEKKEHRKQEEECPTRRAQNRVKEKIDNRR
ncbi:9603_t:CDS:1, partial [Dentiscutata erythropus]